MYAVVAIAYIPLNSVAWIGIDLLSQSMGSMLTASDLSNIEDHDQSARAGPRLFCRYAQSEHPGHSPTVSVYTPSPRPRYHVSAMRSRYITS